MDLITIIIPCFDEEQALPYFYTKISEINKRMDYVNFELLFVDDGSNDGTLHLLREYAKTDDRVRYISFSRNFGKEAAMFAGLERAKGDYLVIMDADLQDPPDLLAEMYETLISGEYDCVATRRSDRKGEPLLRSFFARSFYKFINRVSKTKILDGARDFRMMTRQMADAVLQMKEYNRFSKGIFGWVGFRTKWIEYENVERTHGDTKWSFWNLFKYSMEGIMAFSTLPLSIASFTGLILFIISIIMIVFIVIRTLIWGDPVAGWPAMVCIIFLVGGIQLFCTGIAGQYIAKTYLEVKNRPIYLVKETDEKIKKSDR